MSDPDIRTHEEWMGMSTAFKKADEAKIPRDVYIKQLFDDGWEFIGGSLRKMITP